jgi:hypothetical protein
MKKKLLILPLLSFFISFIISTSLKAQVRDTAKFDYDAYSGCDACGDKISYLKQSKDSLTDVAKTGLYINGIKVKVKLFTCYTGDLYLYINGQKAATSTINSNCACNACDSITFVLSATQVSAFYKINQKNTIEVKSSGSNDLYLDRVIFIREYEKRFNFDAGILSIDSPSMYVCPGTKNIKIKVYNNGKKQFSAVSLDWKWNGVSQTTANYSSSTLDTFNGSGSNTALVSLGSKTFTKAKKDTLIVWTKNPGGVADSANFNDTMRYIFNGSYGDTITVGGTSPMFSTIQAAVNELMSYGVCSPTYIKIRPGTYNEQLYIGTIPGTNLTNAVTFLSSNNDSSSVIINYSANSSENYTVQLEDVSNIKFHRLTFAALNTTYGRVFDLKSGLENIYFNDCAINGISTTSTSTSGAVIYRKNSSDYDKTININFSKTRISNGSYGMYFENSYYIIGNGFYISNCIIENQYYSNLQYQYGQNIGISNSTFSRNNSSYDYGYGLRFNYCKDSLVFNNNKVVQNNGGNGFYMYSSYASNTKRFLIANNFISVSTSLDYTDDNTLYLQSVDYADVVFNSIYRKTENISNNALRISDGGNIRLLYNNIQNDGKGNVFNISSGSSNNIEASDRNNFYNNGNDLGNWYSNSISTIDELASLVGMDSNSISTDPHLMSSTNWHAYDVFLDGRARPFNGITKDLDGENRNSTTPDIGVDEFRLVGLDAGLIGFVKPKVGSSCASVVLRNNGTTTLTSVKIDWKQNGTAKSQVSWTGSLAKGRDTIVCLGNITFAKDTLYKLLAWTSSPNSATDSIPMNDSTYNELYPAMRGEYTIGGTSPDFATFADAVAALEKAGVIDSVLFKVRNGNYTEQIELNEIDGALAKNSVIFQSESKDSSKVTLEYYSSSGSNDNYVVYLNHARGITFRKMTLQNGSSNYQTVVKLNNGARNIRFENNIIQSEDSTNTSSDFSLVKSENNGGKDIYFSRNIFNKGSYGLYIQGNVNRYENTIVIQNNEFKKQSYFPVYLNYISYLEFSNNSIKGSSNSINYGFQLSYSSGSVKIFNNKINITGNNLSRGVVIENHYSSDTVQIYNNFISTSGTSNATALYCYNLSNANIYYNNVLNECTDSSGNSAALYYYYGNYRIFNNNLVHLKNGYSFYRDYVNNVLSNNNNLYSNGTKYINWYGTTYGDLADYSSSELQDTNSIEVDPIYASSSDLHVSFVRINAKAKPIAGITKDIDGQTRNASTPDIGADEFTPANFDASVLKLVSPKSPYKADTLDVDVIIVNLGLDTIKKVTAQIKINNDTLTRKIFNRTFASGDTIHVNLGSYIFRNDSTYKFAVWTSLPNDSADQKSSNDTLRIFNTTPAMSGVYTIGGSSPNFTTFTAAINALKAKGIIDSVRFRVRSGTYYEQLTIPQISGASARNSIIFESQSFDSTAVILEYGSSIYDSNYVIQLKGADGITFRYMTISATSSSNYNHVFDIRGGAKNNTIHKNIIEGTNTNYGSSDNALIFSGQDADDNLWIKDNHLKNGDYAIYLYGYSSYGFEQNLELSGNKILNPYYMGIYLTYNDSASITNNYIYADKYYSFYGMQLQYNYTKLRIERNIMDLKQGYYGIYLYNCGNYYKRSTIVNNAFYLKNPSNYSYGIYTYYSNYFDILHNSINIDNSYTNSRAFTIYYGNYNTVYNNIFVNKGTGYSYFNYYSGSLISNYNDLYSKGTNIGYWSGSNITNIANWKSASNMDTNSISIDPLFKADNNLHVKEVSLNGAAKYFKSVFYDFEGEKRDSIKPDIGADEFTLPSNDAGVVKILQFATDSQYVKVAIKNFGGNSLSSATLNWKFNGVTQSPVSWSSTLLPGDTLHVKLAKKLFKLDTAYNIKVWTSNPNGSSDPTPENDTLSSINQYPALNGEYTIGGTSPHFATFTLAVEAIKKGGIIDSVLFKVRNGTYTEQIEIPNIVGATHKNSVIFQSENKDSSKVIMQYGSANFSNNYVVSLNGASGITFRKITLQNTSSYYRRVVYVSNGSKYPTFMNNVFQNFDSTSSNDYASLVYVYQNQGEDVSFIQNIFNRGAYGLYIYGNSSTYEKNVIIKGNVFKKQGYSTLYLYYLNKLTLAENNINAAGNNIYYGALIQYIKGNSYLNNNKMLVTGNNANYGMYINNFPSSPTTDSLYIYNNFISMSGIADGYSLYTEYLYNTNLYYNNILNECNDSANSRAWYCYDGSINSYNNNFISLKNGYAIYRYYTNIRSNFNNIYTNGTKYIFWSGTTYNNLTNFRSATSLDANSVSINPSFVSSTDLHVNAIGLNGKAKKIAFVTKDIDGETRNSSTPDIGADEYTPPTLDAGITKLVSPGTLYKATTLDIVAVVSNLGIDTIKSVTVQIKINKDTLTRKIFTRTFKSGDTIHVKLGQYTFKADSIYNFTVWTSLPNGAADQKKSNDTLKILNSRPAMTGVYTIGGTTPNFPTFRAAVNALKLAGIIDSVRFRVRTGVYAEHISIPHINGADMRNSIIFESEDQDSTKVTLQYNATTSDSNYVVRLDGADGITFRYIRLKTTSSSNYCRVFDIKNKAHYNTIFKNIIEGPNTNSSTSNNALIFSGQDADDYLQIKDNNIKNGDYAIYLYGYPSSSPYIYEKDLEISGNRILNPYYRGIYLRYIDTVNISFNYIYSDKYYSFYGIYLENIYTDLKVNRNIMDLRQGYCGIYLYGCGNSFKRSLVSNNSIYLKNPSNYSYGIYAYSSNYIDYIHNSINIDNPYTSSSAFLSQYGSNNGVYNNIFVNKGVGYAIYFNSSSNLKSNRNDIYSKGSLLGNWNGTNTPDLATWKSTTNIDTNSISVDPMFKSAADLHVKELLLNGAAKYFKSVPLDFDYEKRDSIKPDIGADEFSLPSNDAGISKIIIPNKPFASDTQMVKVVIKNFGGNKLYVADIGWKFNGVSQTTKSWSDTLNSGDTMHVNLGKKFFHPDSGYSLIAWTSNPNGTNDSIKTNDTAKVYNQYPALSGVYTIGGATPDFATFTDAVTAMKRGGIIDSVRFDVRSGTYYEQINIPFIVGANSENDIIFQSEVKDSSKVYLIGTTSSSNNYVVRLDSVNGVTFRYMGLSTSGTYYYNRVFEILEASKNINIYNCNLRGSTNNTTSTSEAIIYLYNPNSSIPSFNNVEIYNNRFTRGEFGIYAYGYSSLGYGKDLDIHHNNFEDQYYMGIDLEYVNNFHINGNAIYHTSISGHGNSFGIQASYCVDGFELTNNTIYNQEYYGVYMYDCDGKYQDTSLFANNFIHCRTNNTVYGLTLYYTDYINFFNNNIHITSSNASSQAAYIYYLSRAASYNNNFVSTGAGYAIIQYSNLTKSDFNNYYTAGSNLGNHNSNTRSNLAAWKSSTGMDSKSISSNPDYVSATDLHVRGTDLDGKGRRHPYIITKDIDGQTRNTSTPDIGADEFDIPSANDAGILSYVEPIAAFAAGSKSVKVVIKNYGSDSLKSATVKWKVNGTLQSNYSWSGALKAGQTQTITIGNFNFVSGKKHDIVVWATLPNGKNDTTNYNDTAYKYNLYPALDGVYTVGGTSTPDFATLVEANTALKLGGVVDSVWFKIAAGTYPTNITIDAYLGAHPSRPVYFESITGDSSDVIFTNSGTSQIIFINGADYLKFRKLTFKPTYYYGMNAIRYDNNSSGLAFENCYFDMNSSYSYYYYNAISLYSSSGKDDSLTVKNCRFDKGIYGIYSYSNSGNEKGINISNNLFNNQTSNSIYLYYADAPKIRYNTFNNSTSSDYAISSNYTAYDLNFSHNKINYTAAGSDGIYIYAHSGTNGAKANIYNNFIAINGVNNSERGIQVYSSSYVNIYHNSLNVYGSNTGSYAMYLVSGNNYDIRNNVLANTGGGYAVGYSSSPSIAQSNYNDIFTTGTNIGNINGTNITTFTNWKSSTSKDVNSFSLNPTFNSDVDLHTNLSSLDSACLPISIVTDDIDLEARNTSKPDIGADEFQSLPENLGISAFITPVNSCGFDSTFIKVKIFNYGNKPQVGFSVRYKINGGSIISATISDTIKPGKDLDYQFTSKVPLALNATYILHSWTDLTAEKYRANDSLKLTFINYQKPDSIKNMVPADATTGIDFPFTLSWAPSSGATRYDLYVWPFASSRPSTPTVANTSQISQQISSGLTYGDKYNWQVVAKNPICFTPGIVQTFTMKHLPNLFVEEVSAPNTAFSSTSISVSWKIKNSGQGTASGNWYDAIFLSSDGVLDVTDTYLGAVVNPSALNPTQNYTQSANVTLPNGITGNYYIFVRTDEYSQVVETDNSNNSARDTGKVVVSLTPPPDLIVTSVSRPSTAFSGASTNLTYVVKNNGTGNTRSGGWYDRIYLSTEKVINGTSYLLKTNYRSTNLKVDSIYSITSAVVIPNYISGKYFFVVYTDATNTEYEHASESNNTSGSDTIKVILTPPPDLIVRNLTTVDTASNSESVLVKYNIINDGGTSTNGSFYDALWLNSSSTFSSTTAIHLGNVSHTSLISKDTSKVSRNFKMPANINGAYYLFIFTDYSNAINEVGNEGNNGTSGYKIIIKSPDLRVSRVTVASSDTTGSTTPLSWTVRNNGPGGDYQGLRNDSIYISNSATWNRSNSKALGRLRYSATLLKNDTLDRFTTVIIPDGFDGNRYFFVVADASKEVYEQGKDTNNYKRSNLMNVVLAPYPDLLPAFQSFPDSAKAGELIGLSYSVKNQGKAKALPNWKDRYYFSKDSVFNLTKVFTLAENSRTTALDTQATYDKTVYMTLPSSMAKGNYYYFIFTDADKQVYEHFNDSNNIIRTKKIFIDGYPPVDLLVNCPSIKDTLWSGSNYTLAYSVTNKGQAKTAVGAWSDAAYLSTDSILNSGDVLIATININKALDKDSTYTISKAVTIPDGIAGDYYLLVKSDITRQVKDIDTLNNIKAVCKTTGGAKKLIVNLTPPPDLRITTWNIPSTGVSGQPVKIKWTVENNGSGATHSGSWMDQFYLSTDYTIDGTDYHLGDKRHTGNLAVNGTYNDSNLFTIPLDKVGNYIVIIKTDGANVEYEHTNEGNNVVSSVTNLTKAPPADLIVSQVTSPDSVLSGKTVAISWKVKNKGSNPASGYMRDNIYLSLDNKQDAADLLLHSELYYISLAPNTEASNNRTLSVSGVAIGDYYVLVSTDVLNNINESTDTNNTNTAANLLNVNVPILPIATKKSDTLTNNEKIYYRIEIPADYVGESMLITLKADSVKGNNQIFVRYKDMVTGSEFDFKYRESFKGNQEIIIPELKQGTYYLLTTGTKSGSTNYQPIILFARIMPFEIRKVTPSVGGNTGDVTVLIEGSKLDDENIQFGLLKTGSSFSSLPDTSGIRYKYNVAIASNIVIIDPTTVYTTFKLEGKDTGTYDVIATKGPLSTVLVRGFKIVPGNLGDLDISVNRPGNMRTNNIAGMTVIFTNKGNTDLVDYKLKIYSNAGAPIGFSESDLSKSLSELEIVVQENNGPPNRLRPGASGTILIYTKASGALGFTIQN